jgi:hypothetical protein
MSNPHALRNILFLVVAGLLGIVGYFIFTSKPDPTSIVRQFYAYEQKGDFGSAWELFHSTMKERFAKKSYVTERSHIYMSHFGVTTFDFTLSDEAEKRSSWKMSEDGPEFKEAYQVTVQQTFHSKFGTFTIQQEVYVVKEKGQWKIVWKFGK